MVEERPMPVLQRYTFLMFYIIGSLMVFEKVFTTIKSVIDEEFHLRQGIHYCKGNFEIWDPKITTFPGLYLASTALFYYLQMCNVFMLRSTSLIASVINVYLIHQLRAHTLSLKKKKFTIESAVETLSIGLLPPMYFFAHLYYTDVLSITTVLAMYLLSCTQHHNFAALFGVLSILMRQTNVVWVAMIFGTNALDCAVIQVLPRSNGHFSSFQQFVQFIKIHLLNPKLVFIQVTEIIGNFYGYIVVMGGFVAFLLKNGSIVVGDKSAHEAALHVPQIFYFTLFVLFFGSTVWLPYLKFFLRSLKSFRYLQIYFIIASLFCFLIRVNTLVHPYMLADNRHYVFYFWNRFYGKYELARYLMIPVYIAGLAMIYKSVENNTFGYKLMLFVSLFLSLCLQRLIEIRYFLIPFLFLRLNVRHRNMRNVVLEFFLYLTVNVATFYVFFTKEIIWNNYKEPQRLIW